MKFPVLNVCDLVNNEKKFRKEFSERKKNREQRELDEKNRYI